MAKAIWNGCVIAQSDDTIVVEGNHYFPRGAVDPAVIVDSETTSHCPWKGDARYFSIKVGDEMNKDAAWYYPDPKEAASEIKGHVAFWKGVDVTET